MKKIQGISFPRSGHGLLIKLLRKYLASIGELGICKYSQHFSEKKQNEIFVYCEVYGMCQETPCKDARTTFQKSHDFNLDININENNYYLVQIRHPLEAIISWYELELKHNNIENDSAERFKLFFDEKLDFYSKFYQKWLMDKKKNILVITYEDLISNPKRELSKTLSFLGFSSDEVFHKLPFQEQSIDKKRELTSFKYYNENFFQRAEDTLNTIKQ